MHLCLSKFSTIYGDPQQRKLPFSDKFTHAGISWISYVTSRSPVYGYVYITRTRKPEPGYLNLSIKISRFTGMGDIDVPVLHKPRIRLAT
jgi:hypothetical protein